MFLMSVVRILVVLLWIVLLFNVVCNVVIFSLKWCRSMGWGKMMGFDMFGCIVKEVLRVVFFVFWLVSRF